MVELGPVEPAMSSAVAEQVFRWMSARLPGTVAAYLAMEEEVDLEHLFTRLPGWKWVLPRVEDDGSLTLRDRDLLRETHRWGMEQPVAAGDPIPIHEVDLVLVPGLAFDETGGRLGRGKGYYDELLGVRRRDCVAVGVTTAARVVAEVPIEDHDVRVDFLATESAVIICRSRRTD